MSDELSPYAVIAAGNVYTAWKTHLTPDYVSPPLENIDVPAGIPDTFHYRTYLGDAVADLLAEHGVTDDVTPLSPPLAADILAAAQTRWGLHPLGYRLADKKRILSEQCWTLVDDTVRVCVYKPHERDYRMGRITILVDSPAHPWSWTNTVSGAHDDRGARTVAHVPGVPAWSAPFDDHPTFITELSTAHTLMLDPEYLRVTVALTPQLPLGERD